MDMIGNAADALGKAAQPGDRAAQIFMQARPPLRGDEGLSILGAENKMIMQA